MNIVDAYPNEGVVFHTKPLFQWDWGQIVRLHISNLPASYKVEFSNSARADAISTVQATDEVMIPAQFLESGNPIYAWIVVVNEARTTEYSLIIPVSARAKPTDLEPSPEEQTEIEQALSVLNHAVEQTAVDVEATERNVTAALSSKNIAETKASEAAASALQASTASQRANVSAAQANASAQNAANSASAAVTAKNYAQSAAQSVTGVMNTLDFTIRADLQAAKNSGMFDGKDGYSPTATVRKIGNTSVVTITDKNGTTVANIIDGNPGVSPTITVTNIQGGHRITIRDTTGQQSFDVMDGEDGQGYVQDVRINGVSALTGNVANIPIATFINAGLVKAQTDYGIGLNPKGDGGLRIEYANDSVIKNATGLGSLYKPIVPYTQHYAAFYGLAKAAGADEKNSILPTGQYTNAAKSAIQTMLGISGIIAQVEAATASKSYAVGDAFLHGGSLYKASSAISTGDAIVPGTNCTKTTIIEMLKGV